MGERASALAHRVLSRRARSLYWLTLLGLYARRLHESTARLNQWPHARPVAVAPSSAASACGQPSRRREDETAVARLVEELDGRLARNRAQQRPPARPRAVRAMPEGGDASHPLAFESDAERRAMVPELDHAYLSAAREAFGRRSRRHVR